jgi:hypothetical protein
VPIKGLSIAKPTNCGKGTAVRGVTRSGKNEYKLKKTRESFGHVIPTLALSHIVHPLRFVDFIKIKGK